MTDGMKLCAYHKGYAIYSSEREWLCCYSDGAIELLQMVPGVYDPNTDICENDIMVQYRSGEKYTWKTRHIDGYNIGQFGIAVSADGTKVFAQTWDNGLFCFDAKTGDRIWRTKSRRGITDIFVGDDTVTAQLHGYAMQLISTRTGEVIKEKRPCTAWGFTSLDHRYIVCQVTARKWEIIEAETLDVKETFTHKVFTGDHPDFCVNHISLCEDGNIRVAGFRNAWDGSGEASAMLPNLEFEHFLPSEFFAGILK